MNIDGDEKKIFIEANAQTRSFNFYDKENNRSKKQEITSAKSLQSVQTNKQQDISAKRKRGVFIN